jgi:transposase
MSLRPQWVGEPPEETVRVAHAAFPKGNLYLTIRDQLGMVYEDSGFATLYSHTGQPAIAAWRLAWVTIMQFAEGLTDRQAAEAVRGRIDWKYLLGLPLGDAGFDYSVLSEFRGRLVKGEAEHQLLDRLLVVCKAQGWLKAGGQQRTDSTHVLAAIECLHRYELVKEVLETALNRCAQLAPAWLKARVPPEWFHRYGQPGISTRAPKTQAEKRAQAEQIGRDGVQLILWLAQPDAPELLHDIRERQCLEQVWQQQYEFTLDDPSQVQWREKTQLPPASERIASPHDLEARYSCKGSTEWIGYKLHVTETCEPDAPHFITHVETTVATEQDIDRVDAIHNSLADDDLLPEHHLVDSGYVSAVQLVKSQSTYGVNLLGPVRPDVSWQAQDPQAYDVTFFQIDWEAQQVRCPQGKVSSYWQPQTGVRGNAVIEVNFARRDCAACPARQQCTRSSMRTLTLMPRDQFEAVQARRVAQQTPEFQRVYRLRAGVEGTLSQAVNAYALRRARYIGLAKTRLQHIATAVAINLQRLWAWLNGEPLARTRRTPFAALAG